MAPSPLMMGVGGLLVTALVLAVAFGRWGLVWLLAPAMVIARRSTCALG